MGTKCTAICEKSEEIKWQAKRSCIVLGIVEKEGRSNREHRHRRKVVRSFVGACQPGHRIAFQNAGRCM